MDGQPLPSEELDSRSREAPLAQIPEAGATATRSGSLRHQQHAIVYPEPAILHRRLSEDPYGPS